MFSIDTTLRTGHLNTQITDSGGTLPDLAKVDVLCKVDTHGLKEDDVRPLIRKVERLYLLADHPDKGGSGKCIDMIKAHFRREGLEAATHNHVERVVESYSFRESFRQALEEAERSLAEMKRTCTEKEREQNRKRVRCTEGHSSPRKSTRKKKRSQFLGEFVAPTTGKKGVTICTELEGCGCDQCQAMNTLNSVLARGLKPGITVSRGDTLTVYLRASKQATVSMKGGKKRCQIGSINWKQLETKCNELRPFFDVKITGLKHYEGKL